MEKNEQFRKKIEKKSIKQLSKKAFCSIKVSKKDKNLETTPSH